MEGVTKLVAVFGPATQVYEPAPLAVNVADLPSQMTVLLGEIEIVGVVFTEIV